MPLQTFNFPIQEAPDFSGLGDMFQNYWKGYQLAQTPQLMERERQKEQLSNQLLQQQAELYGPLTESQIIKNLREAQTGGLTGTAKNIALLHEMQKQPGHDPELAKKLQNQIDFEKQTQEILNKQHEIYTDTIQYRSATPNQKLMMEIDALGKNKTYDIQGKQVDLTPAQAMQRMSVLSKAVLNNITDQPTRQRLEAASRLSNSLELINPDSAFRYSGGLNGLSKKFEETKGALGGKQSEEYKKFQENLTRLQIASHQVSQFFDLSAAEKIQEDVNYLVNPQNWMTHPDIAKAKYKALVDMFNTEHSTMLQMVALPTMYGFNVSPAGEQGLGGELYNAIQPPANAQTSNANAQNNLPEITDADVKAAAKKYGISEAQVRKDWGL